MEPIELHHWAAFKFGTFEYRLCGYVLRENERVKCIVTEPIQGVDPETETVVTADGMKYRPLDVIENANKIDMMYVLGRWCNLNMRGEPGDHTKLVLEHMGRLKPEEVK